MLRLFIGENQSEKLKICADEMKTLLSGGRQVIAIVPDQFSFAFDKALYASLGAKDFNSVTILSFKRLSESLIDRFGTREGALITQSERIILLYLALRHVKAEKTLKLLSRSLDKPAFLSDMSSLIDTLRRSGVLPDDLKTASESIGGTLSEKLADVAVIYEQYLTLLKERASRDESSIISEGARISSENSVFMGASVYIDRFDSFSPDELMLIKSAIRDADSVTVNLSMPRDIPKSAVSPFAHCISTQNALLKLAEDTNRGVEYIFCDTPKTNSALLAGIGWCLYTPIRKKVPADASLKIYRADNLYEEADLVAAEIRRLVTHEGYSFNDIAVITHDIDSYSGVLEAAFERYGIEAFTDRTQPAAGMSLTLFMLDAVEAAATRQPNTEKILKYLRSPFSPLDAEEVSVLWDYCVRWNVEGNMWLENFTAGECEKADAAREKVITHIEKLRESTKNASAKNIANAFCEFLKETHAAERAFSVIEDCADADMKLETARLFKQLWNAVMSGISSIYMIAGEEKMTLHAFGELLRLILMQTTVATPPQKLDSVTVADVSRSIISAPKIAFVVGLADGLFPAEIKKTGLFSGRDIAALEQYGLSFDITPEARLSGERFDCYKALTAPTERLILSYAGQDLRGKELRPSRFIRRITDYCGAEVTSARTLGADVYCSTPAAAYYSYAVSRGYTESDRAAIYDALKTIPEYREKLARLVDLSGGDHRLSPTISRQLFASGDINVTASRIDVYNRCNFEYFCKYGLRIEPVRPLVIDPANRGTAMHYLFQSVLEHFGGGFSDATDEEIEAMVAKLLDDFSEENLGGDFGKTAKFKADYTRLGGAAVEILKNMREEFKVSKFRPERFEYDLSKKNGESVLSIPISGGVKVNIRGVVDRVDIYTDPYGKRYIRIVDYKTGSKKFAFEDIYNGINLQLLLYMLALTEGKDADFNDCIPSGVLYMRSGFLKCEAEYDPLSADQKSRLELCADQLKRNGLIVENDDVIEAMDKDFSGKYVPVTKTSTCKYGARSQLISEKSFNLLEDYARYKTVRFGEDLLGGKISAVPIGTDSEHLRCAYCDYTSVCDRRKYMMKLIGKSDADELKRLISDGEGDDNE